MRGHELGVHLPNARGYASFDYMVELAEKAETLRFDELWIFDHLVYPPSYVPRYGPDGLFEAFTTMSALTQATSRIRIGTAVLAPLRHPLVTAMMATTVDHSSKGRADFGLGIGWYEKEFGALGLELKDRGALLDETTDALLRLWSGKASFKGRHFRFDEVDLLPKPFQRPHPPIFFGTTEKFIAERVAKFGGGWLPFCPSVKELSKGKELIASRCDALGRDPGEVKCVIDVWTSVARTPKAARDLIRPLVKSMDVAMKRDEQKDRCMIGDPSEVAARIGQYVDAGADQVTFMFPPGGRETEMMELLSDSL